MRTPWPAARPALTVLILTLLCGTAAAVNPVVERKIDEQNARVERDARKELLATAKADVEKSDTAENRYLLGRAYGLLGEFEKAREQFDMSMERDPGSAYPYHGLGVYYTLKGDSEQAEQNLRSALQLDPKFMRARRDLAKLYLTDDDRQGAERELKKILEDFPNETDARALLAQIFLRSKRYDQAIHEFGEVLKLEPEDSSSRKGLAVALALSRKPKAAARETETYLKEEPGDLEAWILLKECYLNVGDQEGALKALDGLIENAPPGSPVIQRAKVEKERIKRGGKDVSRKSLTDWIATLDSDDVAQRREALRFLMQLGLRPIPLKALKAVRDPDKLVRVLAVKNIAANAGQQGVRILRVLLVHPLDKDSEEEVRAAAAWGLPNLKTAAAAPVLIEALDDDSHYVFKNVVESLRAISGLRFLPEPDTPIRREDRAELALKWKEWWAGPRSFKVKWDAIDDIVELSLKRFSIYLALLIADQEPKIAEKARDAFVTITGVPLKGDLTTQEGRNQMRKEALELIGKGK